MSSAIILPIYYDRQMRRRANRREIFIKRFTSGCVVVATLFIVVGLSSSTWYMTILGTFILMIVGLSGFCLKYCDRTADRREARRAISISSRIPSEQRPDRRDDDLPPAYDNIVFDTTSYHISTGAYDNPVAPPPPYEAIFNHSTNTDVSAPTYSNIPRRSTSVPTTLIVPRFSVERDRQSVCLSHAIGLTITSSSQNPLPLRTAQLESYHEREQDDTSEPHGQQDPQLISSDQMHGQSEQVAEQATQTSTDTSQSNAHRALQTITRQSSLVNAQEISQTETQHSTVTPDAPSSGAQASLQSSTRQSSLSSEQETCQSVGTRTEDVSGEVGSGTSCPDREQTVTDIGLLNVVIINDTESVSSDSHIDITSDSDSGSSTI